MKEKVAGYVFKADNKLPKTQTYSDVNLLISLVGIYYMD